MILIEKTFDLDKVVDSIYKSVKSFQKQINESISIKDASDILHDKKPVKELALKINLKTLIPELEGYSYIIYVSSKMTTTKYTPSKKTIYHYIDPYCYLIYKALFSVYKDSKQVYNVIDSFLKGFGDYFRLNTDSSIIKSYIYHELSHLMRDIELKIKNSSLVALDTTKYSRHQFPKSIFKKIKDKIISIENEPFFSYLGLAEIDAIIHSIKQFRIDTSSDIGDKLSFLDLVYFVPILKINYLDIIQLPFGDELFREWKLFILKRLSREALLGKMMTRTIVKESVYNYLERIKTPRYESDYKVKEDYRLLFKLRKQFKGFSEDTDFVGNGEFYTMVWGDSWCERNNERLFLED